MRTKGLKGLPGPLIAPSAPPHNPKLLLFTPTSSSNPLLAFTLQTSLLYLLRNFIFFPISRLKFLLATSFLSVATPVFTLELFPSPWRCLIPFVGNEIEFQHEIIFFFFPNINSQKWHPKFQKIYTVSSLCWAKITLGVILEPNFSSFPTISNGLTPSSAQLSSLVPPILNFIPFLWIPKFLEVISSSPSLQGLTVIKTSPKTNLVRKQSPEGQVTKCQLNTDII